VTGSLASVRLFSDEWFDSLQQALARVAPQEGPAVSIGQIVTGTPDGEVAYRIVCDRTGARLERGDSTADVTLISSSAVAAALAAGEEAVDHALLAGKVTVRGDVTALLRAPDALAALSAAMRERSA
jgi:putative sterol carrier protein